ncbi:MAG: type IX secretion system membrane protein PorP/SprF [Chitinophagales bacterium]|nr:type IX secretion system membrane protein PorP/SprF [Chitinophagales bacterium]
MKHIFTTIIASFLFLGVYAQQPAQYSLFMMNKLNWNPAYAGLDHSLSATGIYRSQWQGIEGNPVTQNISVHMPLNIFSSGVGINLENDELGAERRTTGTVMYNYQMPLGRRSLLTMGIGAGYAQRTLDGAKLRTPEGNYTDASIIFHNDDILPVSQLTANTTTFSAGVYFYSERFEAGFATRHINEPTVGLNTDLSIKLDRAYFFSASANFDLVNNLSFHPSLLVKSDAIQTQTDLAALFRYNNNIMAGVSLRGYDSNSLDAIALILGFNLSENISLAYAYDFTLSSLNQVSNGSHEVMIHYNLNKQIGTGRPPKIIYNPRSL